MANYKVAVTYRTEVRNVWNSDDARERALAELLADLQEFKDEPCRCRVRVEVKTRRLPGGA